MSENIYRMQQQHGHKSFDLVPKTFVLPRQIDLLHEEASAHPEILWIVKPIASSCGRGIFVTDTVDKIPDAEHLVVSCGLFACALWMVGMVGVADRRV